MNKSKRATVYGLLGILAAALVSAGIYVTTQPSKQQHKTAAKAAAVGGQPVASTAGAAMAYAYNASGSGYTIQQLVGCTGAGPSYTCTVVITDGKQQACGLVKFKLSRAGELALVSAVAAPNNACSGG
jgi:hypothetical protein